MDTHTERTLEQERKALPEALRVKPFVISTEDIKLDKGMITGTIEIEKVYDLKKKQYRSDFNDSDEHLRGMTELEPSESDVS